MDGAAASLELGWIEPSGRLAGGRKSIGLAGCVILIQSDVRELKLAKGAVAAGLERLLDGRRRWRLRQLRPRRKRPPHRPPAPWIDHPTSAGNTALRGARILLPAVSRRERILKSIQARTEHVELAGDPGFQDAFVDCMRFPAC